MIIRSVPPSQMGPIINIGGNIKVCPNQTRNYEVDSVPGTSYNWTVPSGATIVSGQGSYNLKVKYTSGFTQSGNLNLIINNVCGSQTYTLLIERNDPPQPSAITGLTNGVCSLTNISYAVNAVPGFSYLWSTSSADAIIISGQNTKIAYLNFNPAFVSGIISISLKNSCGTSVPSVKTVNAKPSSPTLINGPSTVCANQNGVNYSIPAVNNSLNYTWIGPSGSRISDGSTTSTTNTFITTSPNVSVKFASSGGTILARANNSCASGSYKSLSIIINCRDGDEIINSDNSSFDIYPNPATDELIISFQSDDESAYVFNIVDLTGKTILASEGVSNKNENKLNISLKKVAAGIYFVNMKSGNYNITKKLVVR